jgi:bacterioferritin-associated ferredoxin
MNLVPGAAYEPGRCFLCERDYDDGEMAVATGQTFQPDFPHRLFGTKTVCSNCAKAVAQAHEFVTQTLAEHIQQQEVIFAELDKARAERDALQAQQDEGVAGILKLVERTRRAASKTNTG